MTADIRNEHDLLMYLRAVCSDKMLDCDRLKGMRAVQEDSNAMSYWTGMYNACEMVRHLIDEGMDAIVDRMAEDAEDEAYGKSEKDCMWGEGRE